MANSRSRGERERGTGAQCVRWSTCCDVTNQMIPCVEIGLLARHVTAAASIAARDIPHHQLLCIRRPTTGRAFHTAATRRKGRRARPSRRPIVLISARWRAPRARRQRARAALIAMRPALATHAHRQTARAARAAVPTRRLRHALAARVVGVLLLWRRLLCRRAMPMPLLPRAVLQTRARCRHRRENPTRTSYFRCPPFCWVAAKLQTPMKFCRRLGLPAIS